MESENYVTRKLIFVQSLSIHCEPSMGVNWEIIGCNVCVIDWSKVVYVTQLMPSLTEVSSY